MKTFLKILIPLFICFAANSQSITRLTGDTTIANSNNGATLFQIKNSTAYRTGAYLQNYLGGRSKWNFAIDSAYSLGGVLYLVRSTHDTISIAISGTVGVSSVGAGFGTNFPNITTTGSVVVDSFTIATRLRVQKQIDSLATLIGSGGVTSVAAGFGTNFSTITTTGNIIVDSFTIATRLRVKKQIDSLSALLSSYVPVARTLTHSSGFGTTVTGGTQDMSANRTWSYLTDSTSGGLLSWVRGKKLADSLGVIIATKGSGSVTNVGSGFGTDFSAITTTGNVVVDSTSGGVLSWVRGKKIADSLGVLISAKGTGSVTSVGSGFGTSFSAITTTGSVVIDTTSGGVLSWVRGKKIADSLGVIIATKGVGSVTSVAAGYGLNFTTITGSGSVISDTFAMATRARVQKPIDSLNAAIVAGYVPVTRSVAGFALSSNVTLASLTQGYGVAFSSGSTYNASTGITERVDTSLISTVANRDKLKDSLGVVISGYVPITRTVNGKALSSNITLSLASADFANQGTTTTVLHGNGSGNPSFGAVVTADITDANVTYAKIQNVTTQTLVGRYAGTNGVAQEITIGSGLTLNSSTGVLTASGGSSGITIGSTSITSGTNTRILYNNSGVVGEYTLSGSGSVAMTNGSTITNTIIGGTLTMTDNTYNSGVSIVPLGIDTLTGNIYRQNPNKFFVSPITSTNGIVPNTTTYLGLGQVSPSTTEALRETPMPTCTITKMGVRVFDATGNTTVITFEIWKNNASTGATVNFSTADNAFHVANITTPVSFSEGYMFAVKVITNGGSGTISVYGLIVQYQ